MAMPGLSTPPGARRLTALRTLPPSVDCVLSIASPEHFWPRLRFSALRLKTAAAFGSIDCSLRLHSASSTPPSLCFGGMALHSGYTRKLSLATTFRLSPTPLLRRGVGPPPFHRQPETSACYSGPSMPCRRSPSSGRRKPSISALHPTHRGSCHCHSVRRLPFIYRLRHYAHPDARCADAQTPLRLSANHFTHSESAYGLGQGQVGLLSAGQAPQQKACRSVPPRHLPFALILCRHSEFPPFLWLTTSATRNIVITAHRHINHLALINLRRGKAECCRKGQFPRCGNLTFTAAILPRNGVASWGRFCIFREGERGQDENKRQILWRRPNFFVTICQNR